MDAYEVVMHRGMSAVITGTAIANTVPAGFTKGNIAPTFFN